MHCIDIQNRYVITLKQITIILFALKEVQVLISCVEVANFMSLVTSIIDRHLVVKLFSTKNVHAYDSVRFQFRKTLCLTL